MHPFLRVPLCRPPCLVFSIDEWLPVVWAISNVSLRGFFEGPHACPITCYQSYVYWGLFWHICYMLDHVNIFLF